MFACTYAVNLLFFLFSFFFSVFLFLTSVIGLSKRGLAPYFFSRVLSLSQTPRNTAPNPKKQNKQTFSPTKKKHVGTFPNFVWRWRTTFWPKSCFDWHPKQKKVYRCSKHLPFLEGEHKQLTAPKLHLFRKKTLHTYTLKHQRSYWSCKERIAFWGGGGGRVKGENQLGPTKKKSSSDRSRGAEKLQTPTHCWTVNLQV